MTAFFDPANPAGRPSWRKAGRHEGFRIVGRGRQWEVRRVSRKVGQVYRGWRSPRLQARESDRRKDWAERPAPASRGGST
jgi:hypothetical protein